MSRSHTKRSLIQRKFSKNFRNSKSPHLFVSALFASMFLVIYMSFSSDIHINFQNTIFITNLKYRKRVHKIITYFFSAFKTCTTFMLSRNRLINNIYKFIVQILILTAYFSKWIKFGILQVYNY